MRLLSKLSHATPPGDLVLGDTRFRKLLSAEEWSALSPAVRRRFSKRVADGASVVYAGTVEAVTISVLGRVLASLALLIGGPLPRHSDTGVPAIVTVTEDAAGRGQIWTRLYARRTGFPQVIHTAKRFRGPTGLEEYLGSGFGMALAVSVERGAIVFRSTEYFSELFGRRFVIPAMFSPGRLTVTHEETAKGAFAFTLDLTHPWFGLFIRQRAEFREVA